MRYCLYVFDGIGFAGLCISAALVASLSSLARLMLRYSLQCKEQSLEALRRMCWTEIVSMTKTHKNGSNWIVIRLWKFSFLVGVKGE